MTSGRAVLPRQLRVLLLLAATAAVALLSSACGADTVRIATDGDYEPFNFVNEATGEIDGFERELGDELCRRADLECEWAINEWENMIPSLQAGEFDAVLTGMSITAERDELIDFTAPYYPPSPSVYLARAGAGDQAAQGVVGAQSPTIHSDYLQAEGRDYRAFEETGGGIEALVNGDIDALLVDRGYALDKLAEFAGDLAVVGPEVPLDQGLGIGVPDGSDLREKLNEAIESMKADGTLNDLLRKWFGEDVDTF